MLRPVSLDMLLNSVHGYVMSKYDVDRAVLSMFFLRSFNPERVESCSLGYVAYHWSCVKVEDGGNPVKLILDYLGLDRGLRVGAEVFIFDSGSIGFKVFGLNSVNGKRFLLVNDLFEFD